MAVVAATAVVKRHGNSSFGALFAEDMFTVSCTLDSDSLADNVSVSDTVAVPGVKLGDMVLGLSGNLDNEDITVTAYVQAADAVEIVSQNTGGNTVDLGARTMRMLIVRPLW